MLLGPIILLVGTEENAFLLHNRKKTHLLPRECPCNPYVTVNSIP